MGIRALRLVALILLATACSGNSAQEADQEFSPTPNCPVVFAVDTTVRIIAVRQDDDLGERLKAWIRGGTRDLDLPTSGSMPPPTKGFGPETPQMPTSVGK